MEQNNWGIVGASSYTQRLIEHVEFLGPDNCLVCIQGATGTGKMVVAKALHSASRRKEFHRFAGTQMDDEFVHCDLFGHTDQGFSGAKRDRDGFFAGAEGGTAFLDEAGADLSPVVQAKLLDAIEGEEVRSRGADRGFRVNTRFIVATQDSFRESPVSSARICITGSIRNASSWSRWPPTWRTSFR